MAKMVGVLEIGTDKCKGCTYCVLFCPPKCLKMSTEFNVRGYHYPLLAAPELCNGCGNCARMCPDVVIEVFQDRRG